MFKIFGVGWLVILNIFLLSPSILIDWPNVN